MIFLRNAGWVCLSDEYIYFGNIWKKVKIGLTSYFSQWGHSKMIQHKLSVSQSVKGGSECDGADISGLIRVTVAASPFLPNSKG